MDLKSILTNPVLIGIVLSGIGALFTFIFKAKADSRKTLVASLVHHATLALHDWDVLEPSAAADKLSSIFGQVDSALAANGWAPLSEGEKAVAGVHVQGIVGGAAQAAAVASAAKAA